MPSTSTFALTQGWDDRAELTRAGRRQASRVAERFRGIAVRAIYVSDLRRARRTAAPLAAVAGVPLALDARLRERCLGVLEGTSAAANGPAAHAVSASPPLPAQPLPAQPSPA